MKTCYFIHCGNIIESIVKGGLKFKKWRKGQLQQSDVLASSTHKSSPKPSNIQITVGNYEGEDLRYNTMEGIKKVKEVSMKVAEKALELVIPY